MVNLNCRGAGCAHLTINLLLQLGVEALKCWLQTKPYFKCATPLSSVLGTLDSRWGWFCKALRLYSLQSGEKWIVFYSPRVAILQSSSVDDTGDLSAKLGVSEVPDLPGGIWDE